MKNLFFKMIQPINNDLGLLLARAWLGSMMAYHGYGKIFGSMEGFTRYVASMGMPAPEIMAWLAAVAELFGGLLVVVGLATRPALLFIIATMVVAAFVAHQADPFAKKELALGYAIFSVAIFLASAGRYSLDFLLTSNKETKE
ncbi:MAG: DoxX family protein [Blastocatellia bacterium]|nr:DoxX family protein [Blastocatellia bacterium]